MSSKDDIDIGFDPLAWMSDDASNSTPEKIAEAAEAVIQQSAAEMQPSVAAESEAVMADEVVNSSPEAVASVSEDCRINLAGKVDIASAAALKQELAAALNRSGSITLVASDVERADGAGLQLLTSFVRDLDRLHREIIWEEPSQQLINASTIVGLKETLHLP
jgi:anti-anti-sigma regulatory factor